MYFDALTLAAVADELRATVLHGRIQRVLLPTAHSIALEVYAQQQRQYILASAHPQTARVHLTRAKPTRGVAHASPLLLLVRKYILGGRIVAITQPPLERVLLLSIVKEPSARNSDDTADSLPDSALDSPPDPAPAASDSPPLRSDLVIEPMNRRSNIVLVDEQNVILECVKRVTSRMSYRVMLPRQPYELPPAQDKRDPRTATGAGILALRAHASPDLARALVDGYRGISPQVAREVVQRAVGRPKARLDDDTLPWDAIAATLCAICQPPWEPSLVPGDDQPQAYAPYMLAHLNGAQPQASISAALDAFYGARESLTRHQQHRDQVRQQLDQVYERLSHQQQHIHTELERTTNVDHLRWEGEMILAFLHTLAPNQTSLEVEGRTIALDSDKSPLEQAQQRFRTYQRSRSGREHLAQRAQETANQVAGLEQLRALLAVADEREHIDLLAQEAREQGYLQTGPLTSRQKQRQQAQRRKLGRRKPLRLVSSDGFDLFIGRSAEQNADVTFRVGRPTDWWLHVRTIHGAHVIVRTDGREVPERTLQEAAGLAAYFSQARDEATVAVDLSRRKQVRKVPGGAPGLVTYRAERTLHVAPLPPWS